MLDETLHGISPAEHMRRHFVALEQSQIQTVAAQATLRGALQALSESTADPLKKPSMAEIIHHVQAAKAAYRRSQKSTDKIQNQAMALVLQAPKVIRDLKPSLTKHRDEQKEIGAVQASLLADWKELQSRFVITGRI